MALRERLIERLEWSKPGACAEGYLMDVSRQRYKDGVGITYIVKDASEKRIVFKGATRLNLALSTSDIGKWIQVKYIGEDDTKAVREGMNRQKMFRVSVDEERSMTPPPGMPEGITDDDLPF